MRLFVAIEMDRIVRSMLEKTANALRTKCDGVRWVRPEQMHLTLKFLGDVAEGDVAKIAESVKESARASAPFEIEVGGTGCFPGQGPVRVVWIGVQETKGSLHALVERLEEGLERLGIARERRAFSAHLTLGRARADRSGTALRSAVEAQKTDMVAQTVDAMRLMSSALSPKGPTYTAVSRSRFGS